MLLPPVFYIISVLCLESHFNSRYTKEIGDIYTGDTRPLFDGSISLKNAINKNIRGYLQSKTLIAWGLKTTITVKTKGNTILYPIIFEGGEESLLPPAPMQVAADNYKLMNQGLVLNVDVILDHNSLLSNSMLVFYICLSVLALLLNYLSGIKKFRLENSEKSKEIVRLEKLEKNQTKKLKAIVRDKKNLTSEIKKVKKKFEDEKIKVKKNEDEMIKEIVSLEEKMNKNIALQNERQKEIDILKDQIRLFENERKIESKQKEKVFNSVQKRFKALYKKLSINERAISGFIELPDDMKIKSEEIIHKLNEDPKFVHVKRKVFKKKGRGTVQEVIFSYNGRLYFRQTKNNRIEILTMGTKNTQARDLEWLDSI
jgi:hypothetical protein